MPSTYEPIATQTLGSAAASVTFSSIPSTYTDLIAVFNGASTGGFESVRVTINSDTGSNYSRILLIGTGSVAGLSRANNESYLTLGAMNTTNSTNLWQFMNYSNTTTNKTVLARANVASNTVRENLGLWRNTSAITQLDFSASVSTIAAGSTITLYGIKAA
jgi:hypothetical protein